MEPAAASAVPRVSVLMATYNHERYIAQAVQSALEQETEFPVEIVIGEDCSTDRTREILLEFQRTHSDRIRLLLHERNVGGPANIAAVYAACRGDYVAMLEGDDYWTDKTKLQQQVTALERHPHWSTCFHLTRRVYEDGSREPELYPLVWTKPVATIEDLFQENFIGTCSLVFRNRLFGPLPEWHQKVVPGDWAINLLNAAHGAIGFLPEVMADYRIHSQGLWSCQSEEFRIREVLRMFSFVDHHFHGQYREQIEAYRWKTLKSLLRQMELLKEQLRTDSQLPPGFSETPQKQNWSIAYRLIRQIMRPVENAVRQGRAAVGLPPRRAA
jgi:glycosyltransferase involved in cell wall biosynthesis